MTTSNVTNIHTTAGQYLAVAEKFLREWDARCNAEPLAGNVDYRAMLAAAARKHGLELEKLDDHVEELLTEEVDAYFEKLDEVH